MVPLSVTPCGGGSRTGGGGGAGAFWASAASALRSAAAIKDILHRTIRQSAQSFTSGFIDVDTVYDALGHVQKRSEPYFDGGTAY
jgi:hypothetical protein